MGFSPRARLLLLAALSTLVAPRAYAQVGAPVHVKVLGLNDFHGQLGPGPELSERPVGSAAVLASYLRDAAAKVDGRALIVHAGDFVGGSPFSSALLQDEPSIAFLNLLGNRYCDGRGDARCDVVGTLGNHEFDEGVPELLRLLRGGVSTKGSFLERPYRGARVPYVCANVLDRARGKPLLAPFAIQRVGDVRIAVIGAVLTATEHIVLSEGIRQVKIVEESAAINRAVREVQKRGVEAIIVALHQGAGMNPYDGPTRWDVEVPGSDFSDILRKLDAAVDVVVSGHAHQFANALFPTLKGRPILVTQAFSAGAAYADIDLTIDRRTGDVIDKTARIVPTYADEGPGLTPAADVAALTSAAEAMANTLLEQSFGRAPERLSDVPNASGESELGNLLADAQRVATSSQIAFVHTGTVRANLPAGDVTLRRLLAIHPFGGVVVSMDLTGAQIRQIVEQQWTFETPHFLQVSGLTYRWDAGLPVGRRMLLPTVDGRPLADGATYRVAVSDYLARGGGGFPMFANGARRKVGPRDIDALRSFIAALGGTARGHIEGRILRRD